MRQITLPDKETAINCPLNPTPSEYPNDSHYETIEDEEIDTPSIDILRDSDELIACSDGSYDPIEQKAAFNWRIVTPMEQGLTTGSVPVNTNPKYLNSYSIQSRICGFAWSHQIHAEK